MVVWSDARPAAPAPVLVAFESPTKQRRLTVAARLLLCLPHLLLLVLVVPAVTVVVVLGWFGALVLGRLPTFASVFLTGWLRWQTRLCAYLFLLTDVYPPFSSGDVRYPVRVTTRPDRLNRWAVAFRLVAAVPAMVVTATVTYAVASVVVVVTWFIVLAGGRLPPSLHQVFAAFVRYQARLNGYLTMVTSQYPWGLLGDPDGVASAVATPVLLPSPPSPVHDPYWQVVLTSRAKNLVVLFLVLGVAAVVSVNVATAASRYDRLRADEAASARVQSAYQTLSTAVIGYQSQTRTCASSVQPLLCLRSGAQMVSTAFSVFVQRLSATTMPAGAVSARGVLVSDGARAGRAFEELSASSSAGHYQLAIESSKLPQLLIRFDRDYVELGTQLTTLD